MEMGGNELLDLLRRVPKSVAQQMLSSTVTVGYDLGDTGKAKLLFASAKQVIEQKKKTAAELRDEADQMEDSQRQLDSIKRVARKGGSGRRFTGRRGRKVTRLEWRKVDGEQKEKPGPYS